LYASTLALTSGLVSVLISPEKSAARNPPKMDVRMVLVAASDGGGIASIVK
jgi:hypothetical protein